MCQSGRLRSNMSINSQIAYLMHGSGTTFILMSSCIIKQAVDEPAPAAHKRVKNVVPSSTISTRSRAPIVTEPAASDTPTRTEDGNAEEQNTPTTQIRTSDGSNSPDDNQIVQFERQGTNIDTLHVLLLHIYKYLVKFNLFCVLISDALSNSVKSKLKGQGRRPTMGHSLHEWTKKMVAIK